MKRSKISQWRLKRAIRKADDKFLIAHNTSISSCCLKIAFLLDVLDPKKPWVTIHDYVIYADQTHRYERQLMSWTTVRDYLGAFAAQVDPDMTCNILATKPNSIQIAELIHGLISNMTDAKPVINVPFSDSAGYWEDQDRIHLGIEVYLTKAELGLHNEVKRRLKERVDIPSPPEPPTPPDLKTSRSGSL